MTTEWQTWEKAAVAFGCAGLLFVICFLTVRLFIAPPDAGQRQRQTEYVSDEMTVHTVTLPDGTYTYCVRTTYGSSLSGSVALECIGR